MPDLSLLETQPGAVLLDTMRPDVENRTSLFFAEPLSVLTAQTVAEVPGVLEALDTAVAEGYYGVGYLAYEAGYAFEEVAPVEAGAPPLVWFGIYEAPVVIEEEAVTRQLDRVGCASFAVKNAQFAIARPAYLKRVAAIKTLIREGDVYQINFTDKVVFEVAGSPLALYSRLRQRQRVAWGAYLNTGAIQVLSLSPELFFRRDGARIWTRPMKGTHRRGRTLAEDQTLRRRLAADAKNRAENLMIVDLLRNDLSRCCVPGSVQVPALFTTEVYETLLQMTSTVEGRLRDGIRYTDIFRALFPCGSVTGAPKIRAMQCIHDLEAGSRGVYCGTIGYIAPDARAAFNVAIRTAVVQEGRGVMGVGSGIVWDSDPDAEYEESLLKAQFLTHVPQETASAGDFELIETMRAEDGVILLFDLHEERLRDSAAYFGFAFAPFDFRSRVRERLQTLGRGRFKVRITLDRRGRLTLTSSPLPDAFEAYQRVVFSQHRIDSSIPFFYHKTTRRALYEDEYRRARAAHFDEVLFLNERGEVTEGARSTVFVQVGEAFYTPPLSSGLLNGVYRRHLLQTQPHTVERVLYACDIQEADAVYLCNAVRGLQPVERIVVY